MSLPPFAALRLGALVVWPVCGSVVFVDTAKLHTEELRRRDDRGRRLRCRPRRTAGPAGAGTCPVSSPPSVPGRERGVGLVGRRGVGVGDDTGPAVGVPPGCTIRKYEPVDRARPSATAPAVTENRPTRRKPFFLEVFAAAGPANATRPTRRPPSPRRRATSGPFRCLDADALDGSPVGSRSRLHGRAARRRKRERRRAR